MLPSSAKGFARLDVVQPSGAARRRIAVIGGGAFGTALAIQARRNGAAVTIWAREPEVAAAIGAVHENALYLPGVVLDPAITATSDLARAVAGRELVLLVPPAQHLRAVTTLLRPHLSAGIPVVIGAKGIERGSGAFMSEVAAATLPATAIAVLSGPTFAAEVARGLPTAATLACHDAALGAALGDVLGSRHFRIYLSRDVIGVQLGGAVKNVLAIACGILHGRALGDNARATLITRGLAEMMRLGRALGGAAETLMGLAGLGDLVLTCTGQLSRNLAFGIALAGGAEASRYLAAQRSVAEGATTAEAVCALAARHGVELPICAAVNAIANHGADIDASIDRLLSRPFVTETPGLAAPGAPA
ncbi:MAG: NAD(P)-dependent glycerol-3-phosphate dehydrogenase [Alphaproteobacteria bacterium]|nr:NAD(P)-dependent glycerol-3-phosphate dehydrogenase [Alphaproteobacteria bacterium]